jgi:hypothetical protein
VCIPNHPPDIPQDGEIGAFATFWLCVVLPYLNVLNHIKKNNTPPITKNIPNHNTNFIP